MKKLIYSLLFRKGTEIPLEFDESEIFRIKDFTTAKKTELLEYYKVLREMLKNFNNMILDISLRGGTLIISIIAATSYFSISDGLLKAVFNLFIIAGAFIICWNLHSQTKFFGGMLRRVVKVAAEIEKIIFKDYSTLAESALPDKLLISIVLRQYFPGREYVTNRENFFVYMLWFLIVYFCCTLFSIIYKYHETISALLNKLYTFFYDC